jgi:hypothetical protein
VTQQDCRPARLQVDFSPPGPYARAGAYVDRPLPSDPARAEFLRAPVCDDPAEPTELTLVGADTGAEPPEQPGYRPPYFPLRRRGRNLRDAGHAAYYDAANPVAGLAGAYDYARAACTRAATGGMPVPAAEDTLIEIARALLAVGDSVTTAMHTWRPAP